MQCSSVKLPCFSFSCKDVPNIGYIRSLNPDEQADAWTHYLHSHHCSLDNKYKDFTVQKVEYYKKTDIVTLELAPLMWYGSESRMNVDGCVPFLAKGIPFLKKRPKNLSKFIQFGEPLLTDLPITEPIVSIKQLLQLEEDYIQAAWYDMKDSKLYFYRDEQFELEQLQKATMQLVKGLMVVTKRHAFFCPEMMFQVISNTLHHVCRKDPDSDMYDICVTDLTSIFHGIPEPVSQKTFLCLVTYILEFMMYESKLEKLQIFQPMALTLCPRSMLPDASKGTIRFTLTSDVPIYGAYITFEEVIRTMKTAEKIADQSVDSPTESRESMSSIIQNLWNKTKHGGYVFRQLLEHLGANHYIESKLLRLANIQLKQSKISKWLDDTKEKRFRHATQ